MTPETPEGRRFQWEMEPDSLLDWYASLAGEGDEARVVVVRYECIRCRIRRLLKGRKDRRPGQGAWCRGGLRPPRVGSDGSSDVDG